MVRLKAGMVAVCGVTLAGCLSQSLPQIRANAPQAEATSTKPVAKIASCLANVWSAQGNVSSIPLPNGVTVTMTIQAPGIPATGPSLIVDIIDLGAARQLRLYSTKVYPNPNRLWSSSRVCY